MGAVWSVKARAADTQQRMHTAMDEVLTLHIHNARDNNVETRQFERKAGSLDTTDINYTAYEKYIADNYPQLHTFDYFENFEDDNRDFNDADRLEKKTEMEKLIARDNKLLNPIDISMYKDAKLPSDVFDSIARRLYPMGFLGKYARVATALEAGRNYVFTYEQFAHIYPFLRGCTGDAFKLRNWLGLDPVPEVKRFDTFLNDNRSGRLDRQTENEKSRSYPNFRRSQFNNSFIHKPEEQNPLGTDWTYITVDKGEAHMKGVYWKDYQTGMSTADGVSKYYVYEKYLFCSTNTCSGAMKIILDTVHQVVIISMLNTHFDCLETHKRRVFEIVRKLYVIHNADLELIDRTYMSIPRRYGLTFVEAWIGSEELVAFHLADNTPSFFLYDWENFDVSESWSSTKTRGLVTDAFLVDDESIVKRRKKDAPEVEDLDRKALRKRNFFQNGIGNWDKDIMRYNRFGSPIFRDEWEFHLTQDKNEKLREIYRVWRKAYYECEDFFRMIHQQPLKPHLSDIHYLLEFRKHCLSIVHQDVKGDIPNTSLICTPENEKHRVLHINWKHWMENSIIKYKKYQEYNKILTYQSLFSLVDEPQEGYPIITNIDRFVIPYPLSNSMTMYPGMKPDDTNPFSKQDKNDDFLLLIGASMDDLVNSESIDFLEDFDQLVKIPQTAPSFKTHHCNEVRQNKPPLASLIGIYHQLDPCVYENDVLNCGISRNGLSTLNSANKLYPDHFIDVVKEVRHQLEKNDEFLNNTVQSLSSQGTSSENLRCSVMIYQPKHSAGGVFKTAFFISKATLQRASLVLLEAIGNHSKSHQDIAITSLPLIASIKTAGKVSFNMVQWCLFIEEEIEIVTPALKWFILKCILQRKVPELAEAKKHMLKAPPVRMKDNEPYKLIVSKKKVYNTAGLARNFVRKQETLVKLMIENPQYYWVGKEVHRFPMERIEPVEFEAILRNFNTLANISARLEGVPGNLDRLLACLNRGMEVLKNPILQELEAGDHRDVIEVIDLLDRAAKQINGGM